MQSGIKFLRIILLPKVLLFTILLTCSFKFVKSSFHQIHLIFSQLFLFFLLPWGYNNFLSHFYNFHIINHFFLVVGRKSKTIVLVTSFIICHLSLSSIQYLWSRTNSFICISQLDFFPVKSWWCHISIFPILFYSILIHCFVWWLLKALHIVYYILFLWVIHGYCYCLKVIATLFFNRKLLHKFI